MAGRRLIRPILQNGIKGLKESPYITVAGRTGGRGCTRRLGSPQLRDNTEGQIGAMMSAVVVRWGSGWKIGSKATGAEVTQTAVGMMRGWIEGGAGIAERGKQGRWLDHQDIAAAVQIDCHKDTRTDVIGTTSLGPRMLRNHKLRNSLACETKAQQALAVACMKHSTGVTAPNMSYGTRALRTACVLYQVVMTPNIVNTVGEQKCCKL